ncbi:unnamed protein product [Penicillium palitans]
MSRPSPFTGPSSVVILEDRPRSPTAKLMRFAPDRRDWVLFDTAQENEFLSWWLETDYRQQLTKNGKYKFRWSVESRSSKVWRHFDRVAELRSGRLKKQGDGVHFCCYTRPNPGGSCKLLAHEEPLYQGTARRSASADNHVRNLSFGLTEEPIFRELLDLVSAGPQALEIPSSKQLRQHMHEMVTIYQESQLQDLPGDSKVLLALCCWKRPLGQDFMAITAYYFDKKWSYREVLLGFELLCRPEIGTDPGDQILGLIMNKGLLSRIFSVTIDYRVDEKLVLSLQEKLTSSGGISSWQGFVGFLE